MIRIESSVLLPDELGIRAKWWISQSKGISMRALPSSAVIRVAFVSVVCRPAQVVTGGELPGRDKAESNFG